MLQCFNRATRENSRENTTAAPEIGKENAAPASIDGAGAGAMEPLSCADTTFTAAEKIATTRTTKIALEILQTAIDDRAMKKQERESEI